MSQKSAPYVVDPYFAFNFSFYFLSEVETRSRSLLSKTTQANKINAKALIKAYYNLSNFLIKIISVVRSPADQATDLHL